VRGRHDHRAPEVRAVGEIVERLGEAPLRRREAHVDHVEALLDGVLETGEDEVAAAGGARAEHADAVQLARRGKRSHDAGAGRPVSADVPQLVGDDRDSAVRRLDRHRRSKRRHQGVIAVDAAVEDADADALACRFPERPVA
jgi:hypothetical protein